MNGGDTLVIEVNDFQRRVIIRSLSDVRNVLIEKQCPTDDVNDALLCVIDAKPKKKGRGREAK